MGIEFGIRSQVRELRNLYRAYRRGAFRFDSGIKIVGPVETMDTLINRIHLQIKTLHLRYGDGELGIMQGADDSNQIFDERLRTELRESLSLPSELALYGLTGHSQKYGFESEMSAGSHFFEDDLATTYMQQCFEYFVGRPIYSAVALPFTMVYRRPKAIQFFRLVSQFPSIFVGGRHHDETVVSNLLRPDYTIQTSHQNAYMYIDDLESQIKQAVNQLAPEKHKLIFLCCGATANALGKRLIGIQDKLSVLDLGSCLEPFGDQGKWQWTKKVSGADHYWTTFLDELDSA